MLDLVRAVEAVALEVRERPAGRSGSRSTSLASRSRCRSSARCTNRRWRSPVESLHRPEPTEDVDADLLFTQTFVDQARLADNIRAVLPERSSALLSDIVAVYPIEQGAAEIVGYLALDDDDVEVEMDDTDETVLDYPDPADPDITKRARLPKVTVRRR